MSTKYQNGVNGSRKRGNASNLVLFLCNGPPYADRSDGHTIVFTSPDKDWMRTVQKLRTDYYMPIWTLEELQTAAMVNDSSVDEATTKQQFEQFSGVDRQCLHPDEHVVRKDLNDFSRRSER